MAFLGFCHGWFLGFERGVGLAAAAFFEPTDSIGNCREFIAGSILDMNLNFADLGDAIRVMAFILPRRAIAI
jgi:hypothetical protein